MGGVVSRVMPKGVKMKKSDLSYKIKKLLEPCKYWAPEQKKAFMPLVEYTSKLEGTIKRLEDELRAIERPTLPSIFPEGSSVSRSFMTPLEPALEVLSREQRICKAMNEGKENSLEFARMLRWMRLTPEEAKIIYKKGEIALDRC